MKVMDIIIHIDNCTDNKIEEVTSPDVPDELGGGEKSINLSRNVDSGEKNNKEKRMSMSAKKPPKPPCPPRGLSLDAADQKLIKEISELLMIKRARIERIKALKKMKAAKASSAATSSSGNFIAMLFTVLFCVLIIAQGCHSSGIWRRNTSAIGLPTSPKSNVATEDSIVVQDQRKQSTSSVHMLSEVGSLNLMEMVPRSDSNKAGGGKAIY